MWSDRLWIRNHKCASMGWESIQITDQGLAIPPYIVREQVLSSSECLMASSSSALYIAVAHWVRTKVDSGGLSIGWFEESVRGWIWSHCHFLIPKRATMFFPSYEKAHACPLKDQASSRVTLWTTHRPSPHASESPCGLTLTTLHGLNYRQLQPNYNGPIVQWQAKKKLDRLFKIWRDAKKIGNRKPNI
jgi:hypothetical protein